MSGTGRRSQYRKHVTDNFSRDLPLPPSPELIMRVGACRGANIFEVENIKGIIDLATLPKKFHKVLWIKKNDFVLVENFDAEDNVSVTSSPDEESTTVYDEPMKEKTNVDKSGSSSKIKYTIETILSQDQIKHIKKNNLWPSVFDVFVKEPKSREKVSYDDDVMPGYDSGEDADGATKET